MITTALSLGLILGALVALILIAVRATGPARRLGLAGAIVLLVGAVLSGGLSLFGTQLIRGANLSMATYGLFQVPINLFNLVGLILIAVAIGSPLDRGRAH